MIYSQFLNAIQAIVRSQTDADCEVPLHSVIKNNDTTLDALTIRAKDHAITPTIYLKPYYEKYCAGADLSAIADDILSVYEKSHLPNDFDPSFFTDFAKVKDRILFKLVNLEKNRKLLSAVPYLPFLDLAIVFYCFLAESDGGSATILIRTEHLAWWGIDTDELFALAQQNTPRLLSFELFNLCSVVPGLMEAKAPGADTMLVLSNRLKLNGASCLLYRDLLAQISEERGSGFIVLPSSIHEVILLLCSEQFQPAALNRMVCEINQQQVATDEVLSDHIYYYDAVKKQLTFESARA